MLYFDPNPDESLSIAQDAWRRHAAWEDRVLVDRAAPICKYVIVSTLVAAHFNTATETSSHWDLPTAIGIYGLGALCGAAGIQEPLQRAYDQAARIARGRDQRAQPVSVPRLFANEVLAPINYIIDKGRTLWNALPSRSRLGL